MASPFGPAQYPSLLQIKLALPMGKAMGWSFFSWPNYLTKRAVKCMGQLKMGWANPTQPIDDT